MADQQYDVSAKMRELFEKKQQQRAAAKEYYQKLLYSPHTALDGPIFDPSLQRFSAMSAYHSEFFKPKPRHLLGFILALTPGFLLFWVTKYSRSKQEKAIRSGNVRYEDRRFKNFY